MVNYLIHFL